MSVNFSYFSLDLPTQFYQDWCKAYVGNQLLKLYTRLFYIILFFGGGWVGGEREKQTVSYVGHCDKNTSSSLYTTPLIFCLPQLKALDRS